MATKMARIALCLLIDLHMVVLFGFSLVAGACIAETIETRQSNAIMVSLMTHSLQELGEIHTRKI